MKEILEDIVTRHVRNPEEHLSVLELIVTNMALNIYKSYGKGKYHTNKINYAE